MLSSGRREGCKAKGQVRGEGIWRFLPGALYLSVELNSCLVCALFLFCCLYWLRVRSPKHSNKDLEHTLSSVAKGIRHRHLRFVGKVCIISLFNYSFKRDFLKCSI